MCASFPVVVSFSVPSVRLWIPTTKKKVRELSSDPQLISMTKKGNSPWSLEVQINFHKLINQKRQLYLRRLHNIRTLAATYVDTTIRDKHTWIRSLRVRYILHFSINSLPIRVRYGVCGGYRNVFNGYVYIMYTTVKNQLRNGKWGNQTANEKNKSEMKRE